MLFLTNKLHAWLDRHLFRQEIALDRHAFAVRDRPSDRHERAGETCVPRSEGDSGVGMDGKLARRAIGRVIGAS